MSVELEHQVARLEQRLRVTRELLDTSIGDGKKMLARIASLEARLLAPPAVARTPLASLDVTLPISPEEYARARSVVDDRLAACHVDHDACSAEQRGSAGRAAQGPCVRGVVDLVTPSADDQHAAERGTSSAGAGVTASDGGDTARADSAIAERRLWASAIAGALGDRACAGRSLEELAARVADVRAELEREKTLRRATENAMAASVGRVREMEAERDAHRHELANMRAELEREKVQRRAAEEALAAKSDPRNGEARRRGLATGARVRAHDHAGGAVVRGRIVGWDSEGDPEMEHTVAGRARTDAYYADDVELDTEATT